MVNKRDVETILNALAVYRDYPCGACEMKAIGKVTQKVEDVFEQLSWGHTKPE